MSTVPVPLSAVGLVDRPVRTSRLLRLSNHVKKLANAVLRRRGWLTENATPRKLFHTAGNALAFALKRETVHTYPAVVKIDISPLCNLRCTVCVHAEAHGREDLAHQDFNRKQVMSVDDYRRIINEIRGYSSAVSLYYLGDPLMHPHLDEMCTIARDAGLNVHISTNFSFNLSEERLRSIVTSGATHFTVCVDGLSQEKYERTRVGGNIDRVLGNLKRLCEIKAELGRHYPKVEVQFIKFQHNVDELERARALAASWGVDTFTDFWGSLLNYTEHDLGRLNIDSPKANKTLPHCFFPYSAMVIKYNGDVIPCCCHRMNEQYNALRKSPTMGNVFASGIKGVWNSQAYREVRRMVANPEKAARTLAEPEKNFCHGCSFAFNTNLSDVERRGDKHKFEKLYTLSVNGRPMPKSSPAARPRPLPVLGAAVVAAAH